MARYNFFPANNPYSEATIQAIISTGIGHLLLDPSTSTWAQSYIGVRVYAVDIEDSQYPDFIRLQKENTKALRILREIEI